MRAREIKDLCVAREALSRIPGYSSSIQADEISTLVDSLIKEAKEELTKPKPDKPKSDPDDEIPF